MVYIRNKKYRNYCGMANHTTEKLFKQKKSTVMCKSSNVEAPLDSTTCKKIKVLALECSQGQKCNDTSLKTQIEKHNHSVKLKTTIEPNIKTFVTATDKNSQKLCTASINLRITAITIHEPVKTFLKSVH